MTETPLRLIDRFRRTLRGAAPRKLHRHHARENDGRIVARNGACVWWTHTLA
jgi:hypothetical protein